MSAWGMPFLTSEDKPECMANPHLFWEDEYVADEDVKGAAQKHLSQAKQVAAICRKCPFVADCLDHGLRHEKDGYFGGVSPLRRVEMRKAQGIVLETPGRAAGSWVDFAEKLRIDAEKKSRSAIYERDYRRERSGERFRELNAQRSAERKVTA